MVDALPAVTPEVIDATLETLRARGSQTLRALSIDALRAAWQATIDDLRCGAEGPLAAGWPSFVAESGLSPAGFDAGLETILDGVADAHAAAIFDTEARADDSTPAAIVLAANVPALIAQPLLPALAARRPVLIKAPSAAPRLTEALVATLHRHAPALRDAVAVARWPGGAAAIERVVAAGTGITVAYGGDDTMDALRARLGHRLMAFGARLSLAVVDATGDPDEAAAGLARDIALFDQRGCLSIQALYTTGDARALANALGSALEGQGHDWPVGAVDPAVATAVRHVRGEAGLRGLHQPLLDMRHGTVIVDPDPTLRPSPGLRTVRVHPLETLDDLPSLLLPWQGRIQGVALAGDDARALVPALDTLGVTRFAPPGQLQAADTTWHNGGVELAAVLAADHTRRHPSGY